MEPNNDGSHLLMETIRKELESIIDEGSTIVDDDRNINPFRVTGSNRCDPSNAEKTNGTDKAYIGRFPELQNHSVDTDLQKINQHLNEMYDLFQTINTRFENINFTCLKSRVKDLLRNEKSNNPPIKTIVNDLKHTFDQTYMDNKLSELTKEVAFKFNSHPGEFGDIPELSEYFRACSQLQHGLESLRTQQNDIQILTKQMNDIVEISCERVNEIQRKVAENQPEQP